MLIRIVASILLAATFGTTDTRPLPDQERFAEEVRKRLRTDGELQSNYMYVETRRQQKLDKSGRPSSESVKVLESYPGFPGEERWERLISEDGRPVTAEKLQKEDRKRQERAQAYALKLAQQSDADRAKVAREREKARREIEEQIDDAFRVFEIRMLGREALDGRDTIAFSINPRPGVKVKTREGDILRHFKGRAWVSESDYEVAKIELEALDDLSFGLGLFARVHKGSRMSFERRKVNDEVWLPAHADYRASARVMLLRRIRVGGTLDFSGYKRFTVDSDVTYRSPEAK
jgi:hypothetical protein